MSNQITIVTNFIKEYENIEALLEASRVDQSKIDCELSEFYHNLEGTKLGATYKSHEKLKYLQALLEKRRINKLDVIILTSTCDTLRNSIKTLKVANDKRLAKHEEILIEIKERAVKI